MCESPTYIKHSQRICTPPPKDICIVQEFLFSQLKRPYFGLLLCVERSGKLFKRVDSLHEDGWTIATTRMRRGVPRRK